MKASLLSPWLDPLLMLEKYLPSKLYSVRQKSLEETMKWYFSDIASVYQTSSVRGEKKRKVKAMEVGHDSWLTETGYVVLFWGEGVRDRYSSSCKGFFLAHRGRHFRFVLVGNFCFWLSHPEESFSLLLSGNLLMVFDGLGGVLNEWCSPLWVGVAVVWGTGVVSPSSFRYICGQGGIQLTVITSPQPVFVGEPSSSSALPVLLPPSCLSSHSQHLASCCL